MVINFIYGIFYGYVSYVFFWKLGWVSNLKNGCVVYIFVSCDFSVLCEIELVKFYWFIKSLRNFLFLYIKLC